MRERDPHAVRPVSHATAMAVLLVVYAAMTLPFLMDWPPAWPDESLFGEPAAMLARTGQLGSDLVPAFHGHIAWQPPLYFYALAPVIRIVGEDLLVMRLFSTAIGALIVLVTYWIGYTTTLDRKAGLLAGILIAVHPNFTTYIKLVRMDGMCMLFQMGSLLCLMAWSERRGRGLLIAAALLAAAALLTHPLGMIGMVAGVLFLVSRGEMSGRARTVAAVTFAGPAMILLGIWIASLVPDHAPLTEQLRFQFGRKARLPWESAVNFISRYRTLPFFLLSTAVAAFVWYKRSIVLRGPRFVLLGMVNVVALIVVAFTFELPYHVYVVPWLALAMTIALWEAWPAAGRAVRRGAVVLVALTAINLIGYPAMIYATMHGIAPVPLSARELYAQASPYLPSGARVLLQGYPDGYWFLHERRPDLRLLGGIVFSEHDRALLRDTTEYVVVARAFEPSADSLALFSDLRSLLDVTPDAWDIVAKEGTSLRYHPSVWILRLHRGEGKGGAHAPH